VGAVGDLAEGVLLPGALATIMFATGLKLRPAAFFDLAVNRRPLAAGLIGLLLLSPLAGLAIAALAPTPAAIVGLIFLATCPVGILATVATDLFRGNTALSVALTVIVSLVYVATAPFIAHTAVEVVLAETRDIQAPVDDLFVKIAAVTVLPVTGGMVAARLFPSFRRWSGPIKAASSVVLVMVFGYVAARQHALLADSAAIIVILVALMNLINVGIGALCGWAGGLGGAETRALIGCHLIRQEGTAIFIAVSVLNAPDIATPLIVNTFAGMALGAVLYLPLRARRGPLASEARS
jgi:Predicted Na+-dependent transporter